MTVFLVIVPVGALAGSGAVPDVEAASTFLEDLALRTLGLIAGVAVDCMNTR